MLSEAWFEFNGIDSQYMGVIITAMPETVRAGKRISSVTVPGRSGSLHTDEDAFESYTRTMECAVKKRENIDSIASWLVGSGKMRFSTEPDKVYDVTISNKISITQMMRMFQRFMVSMDTQPFKYRYKADRDTLTLTDTASIRNKGNIFSQPMITVYGTGNVTLTVNGISFPLENIEESITIDSELMEVFKGTENQNSKYGGASFPRLETGENEISWTGTVEKVEIVPRWRYI